MNPKPVPTAKFRLGRIVSTSNVLEVITNEDILAGITQHQAGDWGDVPPEDRLANDKALIDGTRVLSAYRSCQGVVFWITGIYLHLNREGFNAIDSRGTNL